MKHYTITNVSAYANAGQRAQQNLDYALTGNMRKADHIAFDVDSDIPELDMSVKSSHFTLVSANMVRGETFDEIWNEYARRVHSKRFAYVTKSLEVFEMTLDEFKTFLYMFGTLDNQSSKCGGGKVIRCRAESNKMVAWLMAQAV